MNTKTRDRLEAFRRARQLERFDCGVVRGVVQIARHTYDAFEVVAYYPNGRIAARRMYLYGRGRRQWALEQARQWADRFGLTLDPVIYS